MIFVAISQKPFIHDAHGAIGKNLTGKDITIESFQPDKSTEAVPF